MNPEYILSRLTKDERFDHMNWVGKDYSIADLKADLKKVEEYYRNLYTRNPVPVKELPTVDELWEEAYKGLSDSIDEDIINEIMEKKNVNRTTKD